MFPIEQVTEVISTTYRSEAKIIYYVLFMYIIVTSVYKLYVYVVSVCKVCVENTYIILTNILLFIPTIRLFLVYL